MQILFLDESGSPPDHARGNQCYFVIGGVIIPENSWHSVEKNLSELKEEFEIRGELKWRFFSPHNRDQENPLIHLSREQIEQVRISAFNIISRRKSIRLICTIASVCAAFDTGYVNTGDELYQAAYKPLTERFQYHLQDLSRTVGRKEYGIIVCDHRGPQADMRLRFLHQRLLTKRGKFVSDYSNLVEGLFLAPSHMSVGIQLADLVAGAVWRKFERQDDRFFNLIRASFRHGPNGQIDGFGIVRVPKHAG